MPKINLRLEGQEIENSQVDLLINISAEQQAIFEAIKKISSNERMSVYKFKTPESTKEVLYQLQQDPANLLIKILVTGRSICSLLIEAIAKNDFEADELLGIVNSKEEEFLDKIIEDLYERRGSINYAEIMSQ